MTPKSSAEDKGYHRLRRGRQSNPGSYYFITTNILNRRPLLSNPAAAECAKRSIAWMEEAGRWKWITFVLMPDHLHFVVELGKPMPLDESMRRFKGYTGQMLSRLGPERGPVWQDGYFEHRLRSGGKFFEVLFYIYWNPVKAGLTAPFDLDYPHWGCREPYREKMIRQFPWLKEKHEKGLLWAPEGD